MSGETGMNTPVSLKPSDMSEGMARLNDEEVIIAEARFAIFDYGGKAPKAPAAKFTMLRQDGEHSIQYYTVGKVTDWAPNEDGKSLLRIGNATELAKGSNYGIFSEHLVNAGFPENRIENDISVFEGMVAHVIQVPVPVRNLEGVKKDATILVVDKIIKLPWEAEKGKKGGKKGSTSQAAQESGGGDAGSGGDDSAIDIDGKATDLVLDIIKGATDGVEKKKLPVEAFKLIKGEEPAIRNSVIQRVSEDEFLNSTPLWRYEGGKVYPV